MIPSTELGEALVNILQSANTISENSVIDYKVEPYPKDKDCELFKDVLAMANSCDRPNEDRWIIFGVENRTHRLIGVNATHPDLLDGAAYQQKLQKIQPHLIIELVEVPAEKVLDTNTENKKFFAFYIPNSNVGEVYELSSPVKNKAPNSRGEFTRYEEGTSFIRVGSSTNPLREKDRIRIRSLKESLMTLSPADYRYSLTATPSVSNAIDKLWLLGSWDDKNEQDREAISRLCEAPYQEATKELHASLDRGLFNLVGSVWTIHDRIGALSSIGTHLTGSALQSLAVSLGEIISSVDEQYSLPEDKRLTSSLLHISCGCSEGARKGAASCCACLSNHRELVPNCTDGDVDLFVSTVLSILFGTDDWRALASADGVIPLLAEASPDMYLASIRQALREHRAIRDYLGERSTGLSSTHMGGGLIGGIMICARQKNLLSKAMTLLVEISSYTMLAKEAIVTVLLPWFPQTEAPAESRIGMGRYLMRCREPQAWDALRELLPNKTTSTVSADKPTYLSTPDFSGPVSMEEFWHVSKAYCKCVLEGMRGIPSRVTNVASDVMSFVSSNMVAEFSDALKMSCDELENKDRYPVWREILLFLKRCAKVPDADWMPSEETRDRLASLRDSIAPRDPYYLALLMHSLSDYDLADDEETFDEMHASALSQRLDSLERAYSTHGLAVVERLVTDGSKGVLLGESLARLDLTADEQAMVLQMFDGASLEGLNTARAYAWFSFRNDREWLEGLALESLPQKKTAQILAALPFSRANWEKAESLSSNHARNLYWKQVDVQSFSNAEEASRCTKRLLDVGRTRDVLEVLSHSLKKETSIDPLVIMDALEHMTARDFDAMSSYYAEALLKHLERISPGNRLCALEFKLSTLLHDRPDAYIFRRMSKDPSLFAQIVSLANSPTVTPHDDNSPGGSISIMTLVHFLPYWKVVPGTSDEGAFDPAAFDEWIAEARFLAKELGCPDGADIQIGRNLFHAPVGPNGFFLPEAVAEFLEGNELARRGYDMESINSRGAHWVDPTGKPEDEIADSYEEKARQAESRGYANLATLMRDISATYRKEAEENRREALAERTRPVGLETN